MPRRPPAEFRRRTPVRPEPTAGLPCSLALALRRTGRDSLAPAAVASALATWRRTARQTRRELADGSNDLTTDIGPSARDLLDAAARALSGRAARELRTLVEPWDTMVVAKTLPDPFGPADRPWWHRRIADLYSGRPLTPRERARLFPAPS